MAKYYKSKVQVTDNLIKYWTYTKPITYDYESKRQNYEKAKEGIKRDSSLYRARTKLISLIDANANYYSKFITLTTKDPIRTRERLIELFKNFKKHFKRKFGVALSYVGVIEGQKERQKKYDLDFAPLHIHLIVFYSKKLDFKILKSCWSYGSVDIKKVDDNANLSIYIAKYLTKEGIALNKKGFIRSHNLTSPKQYESTEFIIPNNPTYHNKYYAFANGKKTANDVMEVNYYEVRKSKQKK